jgi:hypothetical protein
MDANPMSAAAGVARGVVLGTLAWAAILGAGWVVLHRDEPDPERIAYTVAVKLAQRQNMLGSIGLPEPTGPREFAQRVQEIMPGGIPYEMMKSEGKCK